MIDSPALALGVLITLPSLSATKAQSSKQTASGQTKQVCPKPPLVLAKGRGQEGNATEKRVAVSFFLNQGKAASGINTSATRSGSV